MNSGKCGGSEPNNHKAGLSKLYKFKDKKSETYQIHSPVNKQI